MKQIVFVVLVRECSRACGTKNMFSFEVFFPCVVVMVVVGSDNKNIIFKQ